MPDCNETLRELYAFLDGELPSGEYASVESHIHGCMDCLQAFDFQAELKAVVARKCRNDEVPPGLLERIKSCFGDDALESPPA
jgi:mycothiol system anti-sigma-R factor